MGLIHAVAAGAVETACHNLLTFIDRRLDENVGKKEVTAELKTVRAEVQRLYDEAGDD